MNTNKKIPKLSTKAGYAWLLKMAWRDGKTSMGRLLLFMASIILGIAAVVAIQSFGENLTDNMATQSKELMGADFVIDSGEEPNEKVLSIIDSLGGADASEINFASMASFPKTGATKLVQVRGLEGNFPFYGTLDTEPTEVAKTYQQAGQALVDVTLMLQYKLKPGDSIKIGHVTLPIGGALKAVPGRSAISSSIAPSIFIPYRFIEASGLVQLGSRIEYQYYFVAGPKTNLKQLSETVDPVLDAENADLDTHIEVSRNMGRSYTNFGKFLNLVAFIALLLGCIGIASAIHIYIKEKVSSIAILKCLGATRKQTLRIFLIQITAIGLVGGILGATLGVILQKLAPIIVQDLLPIDVDFTISISSILMGIVLGLIMSLLFAILPLLNTWYVSPLHVLRVQDNTAKRPRRIVLLVLAAIFLFLFFFAQWILNNWSYAAAFVLGMLVTYAILAGMATLFMKSIKRYFPQNWGFCSRQSLLNLFRPQNQTMTLILVIGVGTFLISTIYFTKDILLAKTTLEERTNSPNLIMIDIQSEQKEALANTIIPNGFDVIDNIPIITMRVHSINGATVNEIRKDTTSHVGRWTLNHEFRVTYRDSLIASEKTVSGQWPTQDKIAELIPISVAENFANDAGVKIDDQVVFNVQGLLLNTRIASIRAVDWGRMQLNFSIVFPEGILEKAPQFHVMTTHLPDEASSATLQREVVQKFPNVSIIDLRQMLGILENILDKISWVISFMAFFSILTAIIVLIGAVRTSKFQRIKESVMLRTIGARTKQIVKITAFEYVLLGFLGSISGILLSLLGSYLLAYFLFEAPFVPSYVPFLVLLPGITLLVTLIGIGNSRSVINSPPLQVLRKEGK